MIGTLYVQNRRNGKQVAQPKPIECDLSLDAEAHACGFNGKKCVADLVRARVILITADGIVIDGMEHVGGGRHVYQQWWFKPGPPPVAKGGGNNDCK